MQTDVQKPRRVPRVWRIIWTRPRLFSAAALGIVVALVLSKVVSWRPVVGGIVAWDIGVALYLGFAAEMMARADVHQIRRRAAAQDEGKIAILFLTVAAATASLLAIVALLVTPTATATVRPPKLLLAIVTIGLSWVFIHTMFALHYAHEFYDESDGQGLGVPRRCDRTGLLGLRLLRGGDRHGRTGLRRGHHDAGHPPHRRRTRRRVILLQRRDPRPDGEHRSERDPEPARPLVSRVAAGC